MPGLAVKIDFINTVNSQKCLKDIVGVYKVPTISYKENYIATDNVFIYSLSPNFNKEQKLGKFLNDRYLIASDGDYYNQDKLNDFLNISKVSKLETLLHLYLQVGDNFAQHINGEFVLVIIDTLAKKAIVTNDRFGRRVHFWNKSKSTLLCGSEKKAILALTDDKININSIGLLEVFTFNHNINGNSFLDGVKVLKPANIISFDQTNLTKNKYHKWDFNKTNNDYNRAEHVNKIKSTLIEASNKRIIGKERILLWLSGGYDSRALACSVDKKYRGNIITDTFGENASDEVKIAELLAQKLGFKWRHQKVNMPYLTLCKLSAWRTEFSVPAQDHPFIGKHKVMKEVADFIIQGVPGLNEINSGHLRLGKILDALKPNTYENYFSMYSKKIDVLAHIFQEDFLSDIYSKIKFNFVELFTSYENHNDLYKWDIFNLTQRQPNYSYMADLVENDLFETIHPFTDIDLVPLFTEIPFRDKLFMQLTKDLFNSSFPEVKEIPFGDGRGIIKSNNSLINTFIQEAKLKFSKTSTSIIWNKKKSVLDDYEKIRDFILERLKSFPELQEYFDTRKIEIFLSNRETVLSNIRILDLLVTFLFSYEQLLKNNGLSIPEYITNHYKEEF